MNQYLNHSFSMKTIAFLLVLVFAGQASARTQEMRAVTPKQECIRHAKPAIVIAGALIAIDCIFFACAGTIATAITLNTTVPVVVGSSISLAGASACAKGAMMAAKS